MIFVIVIIALIVLFSILASLSANKPEHFDTTKIQEIKGKEGENIVNDSLEDILDNDEYILNNVLLPLNNGFKTELDTILITHKGIFCIEIKNWAGNIDGNDEDEKWIQKYDDYSLSSKEHQNPVKQNQNHCNVLERMLNNEYEIFNVVIFPHINEYSNIDSDYTYSLEEFKDNYDDASIVIYHAKELERIYNKLIKFKASEEELKAHRNQVRQMHK